MRGGITKRVYIGLACCTVVGCVEEPGQCKQEYVTEQGAVITTALYGFECLCRDNIVSDTALATDVLLTTIEDFDLDTYERVLASINEYPPTICYTDDLISCFQGRGACQGLTIGTDLWVWLRGDLDDTSLIHELVHYWEFTSCLTGGPSCGIDLGLHQNPLLWGTDGVVETANNRLEAALSLQN